MTDFKYEFDHFGFWQYNDYKYLRVLFVGYTVLHQFIRQDIKCFNITNKSLIEIIEDSLEKGETIEERSNIFILKLNKVNEEIIEYIKLLLRYSLIIVEDFEILDNNIIKWKRIYAN